ncbi:MAG TPA: hypothetical protein VF528_09165 [Pyrinomonadaceae bacterium]|jgi:hypothetical protein
MKRYLIILIFASVLLLSACSYTSNFVVVNESGQPIKVQYKIKNSPSEPLQLVGAPAKTAEANLRNADKQWRVLESGEYELDREARTITIDVMPHEALRVLYITNYGGHDDASDAGKFEIDEIILKGAHGEAQYQGEQIRRQFTEATETLYLLTYK